MEPQGGPRALGTYTLTDLLVCADFGEDEALRLVASAGLGLDDPVVRAVVEGAHARGLLLTRPETLDQVAGEGIRATVGGHDVRVGSLAFTKDHGWQDAPTASLARHAAAGKVTLLATVDGKPLAILALERSGGAHH